LFPLRITVVVITCTVLFNCGGGDDFIVAPFNTFPYSETAHPELDCALAVDSENTNRYCSLSKLPLIGMVNSDPNNQAIADRLLVSHKWMGDRFMALLDKMPADIKLMLRSVTAIVIAGDIRPSFYTTETGAIYLDPYNLWLTEKEKNTISKEADYRSGYSDGLNFTSLWRYLKPDGSLTSPPSTNRVLDDLTFPLARLLYHELAHANTFLPPSSHAEINPNHKVYEAAETFLAKNASYLLEDSLPLQSPVMKELAFVMFRGKKATQEQVDLSAAQVGNAMASDRANDDYAYVPYSDEIYYEDVAMLLEELMSKYRFNYDREIAYANAGDSAYCDDYLVAWGQTGRIGDSKVKEAARLAVKNLIPEINLDSFIDNLELPEQSTSGIDWCAPIRLQARALGKGSLSTEALAQDSIFNQLKLDISNDRRSPHDH
jgi:hypothetical protein